MGNCEMKFESDLKMLGRGSYDWKWEDNHEITAIVG